MRSFKKYTPLVLLFIFVFATGFGFKKKDEAYYIKNPAKAKEKSAACEKVMNKLAEAGNIKKLEEMAKGPECNAANNAVVKLQEEERKRKREQYEKEKVAERTTKKVLLEEHYKAYREIPLAERLSEKSAAVSQWLKECRKISSDYLECQTEHPGKLIYEESYKKYSTDNSAKDKKFQECLGYEAEYNKMNKTRNFKMGFNPRPRSIGFGSEELRGVNECHAAYDVVEDELVEKYKSMPLKQRVEEQIKCNESENDDICSESLKRANKALAKNLKEKISSDSTAENAQYDECKKMQKELNQKGRDFMFIMRTMGECKAVNYF